MRPPQTVRRMRLLAPIALLLVLTTSSAGSSGADSGEATAGWERKLDPFLRRIALGTVRVQGRFVDAVARRSATAARSLPAFVQVERADAPIVQVKAGISEKAFAAGRGWEELGPLLSDLGVEIRGRVDGIASLRVPAAAIERLADLPEIAWLKAAHTYKLLNEISTSSAQIASDDANTAFDRGAGVIVAVVDTGIQWTDRDTRKTDGTTRILGIWDQTLTDPAHPPPAGFSFGAYYPRADIDAAIASGGTLLTGDGHGHGTHVAGTAAGNGLETGNGVVAGTFAGVAPEADLLVVRVFDNNGNFCGACDLTAAVQFIARTAAATGKPWVGNMSLGTDLGAHDGTDPDEMSIDAAVGPGTRGAAMAIAAGNSGGRDGSPQPMHWEGPLPAAGASISNTFPLSYTPKSGADNDDVWIDLWYKGADSITVEIVSPTSIVVGAARGVDSGVVCTADGAVQVDATPRDDGRFLRRQGSLDERARNTDDCVAEYFLRGGKPLRVLGPRADARRTDQARCRRPRRMGRIVAGRSHPDLARHGLHRKGRPARRHPRHQYGDATRRRHGGGSLRDQPGTLGTRGQGGDPAFGPIRLLHQRSGAAAEHLLRLRKAAHPRGGISVGLDRHRPGGDLVRFVRRQRQPVCRFLQRLPRIDPRPLRHVLWELLPAGAALPRVQRRREPPRRPGVLLPGDRGSRRCRGDPRRRRRRPRPAEQHPLPVRRAGDIIPAPDARTDDRTTGRDGLSSGRRRPGARRSQPQRGRERACPRPRPVGFDPPRDRPGHRVGRVPGHRRIERCRAPSAVARAPHPRLGRRGSPVLRRRSGLRRAGRRPATPRRPVRLPARGVRRSHRLPVRLDVVHGHPHRHSRRAGSRVR